MRYKDTTFNLLGQMVSWKFYKVFTALSFLVVNKKNRGQFIDIRVESEE